MHKKKVKAIFTKKIVGIVVGIAVLTIFLGVTNSHPKTPFAVLDKAEYVAQVNSTGIKREDYQKKLEQEKNFFVANKQPDSAVKPLAGNVLDTMIDNSIVVQYATQNKIMATDAEIAIRYNQVVAGYNKHNNITQNDDIAFLQKIKQLYGIDKNTYLEEVKMDILREKVQEAVKMPLIEWLAVIKNISYIKKNN